jgi:hypothetical protein
METTRDDADLLALRDALMAYSGSTEAEHVLGTLGAWWGMRPEQVAPVVAAVAGTVFPPPVVVLWLYWTAALARTPNGGELLLKAGWTVAAARGIDAAYLELLGHHVIGSRRSTERTQ